jgi:hypothetical protein
VNIFFSIFLLGLKRCFLSLLFVYGESSNKDIKIYISFGVT